MNNLQNVLRSLKGDKIKERQEGLASIRTIFARDKVVANVATNSNGDFDFRAWLTIFQAIFHAVLSEKLAFTKKSTKSSDAAKRRLAEAASTLRWLIERTSHLMNKQLLKAMFEHLCQTMVHKDELLQPVALDYIKALKYLVSFTPHLQRIEVGTWVRLVEIGFNVVLGDPIRSSLERDLDETPEHSDLDVADNDSDMFDVDDDSPSTSATSRKRRRRDSDTTPQQSPIKGGTQSFTTRKQSGRQILVTLEQVEFNSLLSILLGSPSCPILSQDSPRLASSILLRQQCFLSIHPADTSLLHDYLNALLSTLSHVSLNKKHDIEKFARASWDRLVNLWGTKNKRIKEVLVAVLRMLFPFVSSDSAALHANSVHFNCAESIGRLWGVLDSEADSRWGIDGLSLDSLRLELLHFDGEDNAEDKENVAFVAKTFRAGWNFDVSQALAWAILELQADCAGKLFQFSESMHPLTPAASRNDSKRARSENPIGSLLSTLQTLSSPRNRAYHLQILLFIIDRHWSILHDYLHQTIISALLQLVTSDDGVAQSWAFLCFAAIADAENSEHNPIENNQHEPSFKSFPLPSSEQGRLIRDLTTWDAIWTHSIRRVNVPIVCRAACHSAHAILVHSHTRLNAPARLTLTSQRVLLEIETLAKDLDVQGPSYPYDSVCNFLAQCLKVSSQDVRLYRMHLEEKVLSWLIDSWRMMSLDRDKMASHMVKDILLLLESVCGFAKRSDLVSRIILPECQIVTILVDEGRAKTIRDFLLDARLPKRSTAMEKEESRSVSGSEMLQVHSSKRNEVDLLQPRGRERKVSSFMLKYLEVQIAEMEGLKDNIPTAEAARRSLDMAVIALSFESLLVFNGTHLNRRVMQCACKVIANVTAYLTNVRWSTSERALVSLGLYPLTFFEEEWQDERRWEAMLPPDIGTGIKTQTLRRLTAGRGRSKAVRESRMNFLRIIWQSADVQDVFRQVMDTLRNVLSTIIGDFSTDSSTHQARDIDDKDGFGPVRTTAIQQSPETNGQADDQLTRYILDICIAFLSVGPVLLSASGEPTRDKDLIKLILSCAEPRPEKFLLVCPVFLDRIRQGTLNITLDNLDGLLTELGDLLQLYFYARSDRLQLLSIQLLDSTLDLWSSETAALHDVRANVRGIYEWLSSALEIGRICPWIVRDSFARFLDRYIEKDPHQISFTINGTGMDLYSSKKKQDKGTKKKDELIFPSLVLPMLGSDEDIRVRFRVAAINARLFSIARRLKQSAALVYSTIKEYYTKDADDFEHVLTRLLSLGNIMVVSSAIRRGPYWHLLETCMHSPLYSRHIEAILGGVSQRMGFPALSVLFEAYASQLVCSVRRADSDFLRFPPHLLGYQDRKECAVATFRSFTPTNMLMMGGVKSFEGHCKVIQKSIEDGISECFGDIVGYQIVNWFTDFPEAPIDELGQVLWNATMYNDDHAGFDNALDQNFDGVAVAILRALGDQDHSNTGPIVQTLESFDQSNENVQVFRALTRYRNMDDFETHEPNLPAFPTHIILRSLSWLGFQSPNADPQATTYHVLHQLFAAIQYSLLVNEQIRLINALSLWISLHHQDFAAKPLLQALIHGATSLMSQPDLARAAQSILEWAFGHYRKAKAEDASISDILIRICCVSHDYSSNMQDPWLRKLGNELLEWIDNQAVKLSEVPHLNKQILEAIPAWSHPLSAPLAKLYESITSSDLSEVLRINRISSNKFRFVRRLRDHAKSLSYGEGQFAKTDFWRLKECMPPADQLQDDDIDAFAALLVLNKGSISNLGSDQSAPITLRSRHHASIRKKTTSAPRDCTILELLTMLKGKAASQVFVTYDTLRLIVSVPTVDISHSHILRSEHSLELGYLQRYQRSPKSACHRDLRELFSEPYSDCTADYSQWISMVTILLAEFLSATDSFYAQLTSILKSNVLFAEQILPVLVHTILQTDKVNEMAETNCRSVLSQYFTSILSLDTASIPCVQSIVETVLHLRHFPCNTTDALAHNKWLDIDFTLLARKAILCGAYTTALLFLELASEYRTNSAAEDISVEQILYEIYSHIDEPDGFYGIKSKDLHRFLIKRFHHEKQWEKAFRFHGATLEAGSTRVGEAEGLLKAFHSFGFDHLAIGTMQNSTIVSDDGIGSSGMSYRLGWRTETWDLPDGKERPPGASLYHALRAIYRERDPRTIDDIVRRSLFEEMGRLRALGSENLAEIREVAQDLMCLSQITQWRHNSMQMRLSSSQIDSRQWGDLVNMDAGFGFSDLENIMATRISLVRSARQKEERSQIGNLTSPLAKELIEIEKKCLVRLSEAARDANQIQIALNSVVKAQRLEELPSFEVSQEFASVLWLQREQKLAVQFLDGLIRKETKLPIESTQKALLLARLGAWSSEACLEKPMDIWSRFFKPAVELVNKMEHSNSITAYATIYHECAMFSERQYHAILKSPNATRWKMYVDRKRQEIQHREQEYIRSQGGPKAKGLKNELEKARKLLQEDSELISRHNVARDAFLKEAINMYSRCLQASDTFDDDGAIRLCSLWFANFDEASLQDKVKSALERIPSRKMVFLAHQLSARISKSPSAELPKNQENLQQLVIRMCKEHPFHSLYQVYSLSPDRPSSQGTRRQSGRHLTPSTQTERSAAAGDIFDRLRGDPISGSRALSVEQLCDACSQWAKFPIQTDNRFNSKQKSSTPFNVPEDLLIRKINNLRVPVMTHHLPLDATMAYESCPWIARYGTTFETAGGINLPKISVCHSMDGQPYKQLFKGEGNDDLRQDAVMEQVFELVNKVLLRDRETRRRDLSVRDYRVIPLGSQAGLLEFVGNTLPLGNWLNRAHVIYRPNDMKAKDVATDLGRAQKEYMGQPEKLARHFRTLQEKFQPVMRHYFTERHKTPISWFTMRLNYTRSVATTSIVGHILGLGDRHISNILLDNVKGEVVHIDLGIAFDQGKLLPIPECVPFRMTADMVDGMGTSGTQGVFQRCAEETLRVLREDSEVIMTVLEVFKHDPLHSWTASELKVKRVQGGPTDMTTSDTSRFGIGIDMSSGTAEEAADRALSSVARKLDKALSVEYTVNELIAEATDPYNLARIFTGWSPQC